MRDTNTSSKTYEFKAETRQLLDILVHSLYTSREIFLRELISNASDALDKLRFESIKGHDIVGKDLPLEIKVDFDDKNKTITVEDTGIGMTADELVRNIGTIAKSGSAEFVKMLKENKAEANNIIGKFGVGFYSVFMVAKEVIIHSRSFRKDTKAVVWKSDGQGSFEISETNKEIKRGTRIEIRLKDDAHEFADKFRLQSIIRKYSSFISFPIYLGKEKINTIAALWREPKSNIKPEQYNEFYKFLTYDTEDPADVIHNSVDAPIQFSALLFIPKKNQDFFGLNRDHYGLDLYVRRVLIQHQNKDLLPEYLSFVKGVVDSEDLPLNISRETLQENIIFTKISNNITTQVLNHLIKKAKDEPEKYAEFWKEHGRTFKLGYMDFPNLEKFTQLLRFNASFCKDEKELVSLEDYVSQMKENQNEIYYALGSSRDAIDVNPHLEFLKKKGVGILYLYDPLDEFVLTSVRKYKDYEFKSVDAVDPSKLEKIKDSDDRNQQFEPLSKDDEKHFDSLLAHIKKILGDKVTDVRESKRLTDSAVCLVNTDDSSSAAFQKLIRMASKETPEPKRIMEVNRDHKLIRNLLKVFKSNSNDEFLKTVVEELYESALLIEGDLNDPHKLVKKLNKLLEQSSGWYVKLNSLENKG